MPEHYHPATELANCLPHGRRYFIVLDGTGRPRIEGTTLKVIELVVACQAYGWSPEEYHLQHSGVGLAQIHAALAYYYDHQEQLEADIREEFRWAEGERERNLEETANIRERLRRSRQKTA